MTTKQFAKDIRILSLETFKTMKQGHIGGAMSVVEILAVLYNDVMRYDAQNPKKEDRDRLVMSKGHAGVALYSALSLKGFFPKETLKTVNKNGTILPSHCDMNLTPGVDMSTGSLGQGASTALGLALGQKMRGFEANTFLIIGDGECNEGQVWESVMLAAHKKVSNLVIFCDYNKQQLDGYTKNVLDMGGLEKFADKFTAFGCHTQTVNGHDTDAIKKAIDTALSVKDNVSVIVLDTKKGYGCDFAEDVESNHHFKLTGEEISLAIEKCKEANV